VLDEYSLDMIAVKGWNERALVREGVLRKIRWPRSDIPALIAIVVTAVGSLAAVITIPEMHDVVFGSALHDHPVAGNAPQSSIA
jgi:hypothetical protein